MSTNPKNNGKSKSLFKRMFGKVKHNINDTNEQIELFNLTIKKIINDLNVNKTDNENGKYSLEYYFKSIDNILEKSCDQYIKYNFEKFKTFHDKYSNPDYGDIAKYLPTETKFSRGTFLESVDKFSKLFLEKKTLNEIKQVIINNTGNNLISIELIKRMCNKYGFKCDESVINTKFNIFTANVSTSHDNKYTLDVVLNELYKFKNRLKTFKYHINNTNEQISLFYLNIKEIIDNLNHNNNENGKYSLEYYFKSIDNILKTRCDQNVKQNFEKFKTYENKYSKPVYGNIAKYLPEHKEINKETFLKSIDKFSKLFLKKKNLDEIKQDIIDNAGENKDELIERICTKYGIEPKNPIQNTSFNRIDDKYLLNEVLDKIYTLTNKLKQFFSKSGENIKESESSSKFRNYLKEKATGMGQYIGSTLSGTKKIGKSISNTLFYRYKNNIKNQQNFIETKLENIIYGKFPNNNEHSLNEYINVLQHTTNNDENPKDTTVIKGGGTNTKTSKLPDEFFIKYKTFQDKYSANIFGNIAKYLPEEGKATPKNLVDSMKTFSDLFLEKRNLNDIKTFIFTKLGDTETSKKLIKRIYDKYKVEYNNKLTPTKTNGNHKVYLLNEVFDAIMEGILSKEKLYIPIYQEEIIKNFYKLFLDRIEKSKTDLEKSINTNIIIEQTKKIGNITRGELHSKNMLIYYIIPLIYLIYSYVYIKFNKQQKLRLMYSESTLTYEMFALMFDTKNPVIKKINVYLYETFNSKNKENNEIQTNILNDMTTTKDKLTTFLEYISQRITNENDYIKEYKILENIVRNLELIKGYFDDIDKIYTGSKKKSSTSGSNNNDSKPILPPPPPSPQAKPPASTSASSTASSTASTSASSTASSTASPPASTSASSTASSTASPPASTSASSIASSTASPPASTSASSTASSTASPPASTLTPIFEPTADSSGSIYYNISGGSGSNITLITIIDNFKTMNSSKNFEKYKQDTIKINRIYNNLISILNEINKDILSLDNLKELKLLDVNDITKELITTLISKYDKQKNEFNEKSEQQKTVIKEIKEIINLLNSDIEIFERIFSLNSNKNKLKNKKEEIYKKFFEIINKSKDDLKIHITKIIGAGISFNNTTKLNSTIEFFKQNLDLITLLKLFLTSMYYYKETEYLYLGVVLERNNGHNNKVNNDFDIYIKTQDDIKFNFTDIFRLYKNKLNDDNDNIDALEIMKKDISRRIGDTNREKKYLTNNTASNSYYKQRKEEIDALIKDKNTDINRLTKDFSTINEDYKNIHSIYDNIKNIIIINKDTINPIIVPPPSGTSVQNNIIGNSNSFSNSFFNELKKVKDGNKMKQLNNIIDTNKDLKIKIETLYNNYKSKFTINKDIYFLKAYDLFINISNKYDEKTNLENDLKPLLIEQYKIQAKIDEKTRLTTNFNAKSGTLNNLKQSIEEKLQKITDKESSPKPNFTSLKTEFDNSFTEILTISNKYKDIVYKMSLKKSTNLIYSIYQKNNKDFNEIYDKNLGNIEKLKECNAEMEEKICENVSELTKRITKVMINEKSNKFIEELYNDHLKKQTPVVSPFFEEYKAHTEDLRKKILIILKKINSKELNQKKNIEIESIKQNYSNHTKTKIQVKNKIIQINDNYEKNNTEKKRGDLLIIPPYTYTLFIYLIDLLLIIDYLTFFYE